MRKDVHSLLSDLSGTLHSTRTKGAEAKRDEVYFDALMAMGGTLYFEMHHRTLTMCCGLAILPNNAALSLLSTDGAEAREEVSALRERLSLPAPTDSSGMSAIFLILPAGVTNRSITIRLSPSLRCCSTTYEMWSLN